MNLKYIYEQHYAVESPLSVPIFCEKFNLRRAKIERF
ncbi:hypothetical protein T06_5878 [Trichinella sp. T6]|nr:hypothetical protein T06_5878 [Trichinella sp. T6]